MAKKAKKTEKVEVEPQIETMEEVVTEFFEETLEKTVVAKPKRVEKKNPKLQDGWEVKDRIYRLKGNKKRLLL